MKWIHPKAALACMLVVASPQILADTTPPAKTPTKTIFSLDRGQDFQTEVKGEYYIQLGSFRSKTNAVKIFELTKSKTSIPVAMKQKGEFYVVTLGPIADSADVRAISEALASALPRLPMMPPVKVVPPPPPEKPVPEIPEQDNWYVEVTGGAQSPMVDNTMTASNGFELFLPPPYDMDTYKTATRWSGELGVGAGYRWQPNTPWFPAYSLGLRYRHYFPTNIGQAVSQFSTPEFTNYYNWNVIADAMMIAAKLNISQFHQFSPFVDMSAGMALNRTYNFYESPSMDVDPPPQPGFGANHTWRFTYTFGAGIDWQVKPKIILSLSYQFQGMGSLYSSTGHDNYSNSSLYSKVYQTNNLLLSLTYLLGDTPAKA